MSLFFAFILREVPSDVAGMNTLGQEGSTQEYQLDYVIPPNGPTAVAATFITPAPLPGVPAWAAGQYFVGLQVAQATSISFTVELWRADQFGNDIALVGTRPVAQTGTGTIGFSVSAAALDAALNTAFAATDRLKLKILAQNSDPVVAYDLSIMTSLSTAQAPIVVPDQANNMQNAFRRGRFLGIMFRPGDGSGYFDKNGVDLEPRLN